MACFSFRITERSEQVTYIGMLTECAYTRNEYVRNGYFYCGPISIIIEEQSPMTQNTSHATWQYAFDHTPILDHSEHDLYCPARLADSVETYMIATSGEVYVRLNMGACKLLAYYCDDNTSGSLAMASQFADYRSAFNGWIKNVALNAPMGHATFDPLPYPILFIHDDYMEEVIATNVYARLVECRTFDTVHLYRVEYADNYSEHVVHYNLFDAITVLHILHSFVD